MAAEIQCFGANTFATIFRGGKGVLYREVLTDVCDKLKVNYHEKSSVERIELALLSKILEDALNKMTQEQLKEIASELGVNNVEMMSKGALAAVIIKIFNFGGFYSYQLTVIIVNAILKALIGRGLSILGNTILVRILSIITGPIGLVVTGIWTAVDIAGAAYRVTIPAVIAVAALRQKHLHGDMGEKIFDK
ncbi:YaaW family protein [Neisseria sp. S1]|uniref:YaaW family protein n=1 Tax=Neisseria sp. S1 TaxID=3318354 RepID=UPI003A85DBFA